jgi:hypothetical protein
MLYVGEVLAVDVQSSMSNAASVGMLDGADVPE